MGDLVEELRALGVDERAAGPIQNLAKTHFGAGSAAPAPQQPVVYPVQQQQQQQQHVIAPTYAPSSFYEDSYGKKGGKGKGDKGGKKGRKGGKGKGKGKKGDVFDGRVTDDFEDTVDGVDMAGYLAKVCRGGRWRGASNIATACMAGMRCINFSLFFPLFFFGGMGISGKPCGSKSSCSGGDHADQVRL